MARTMWQSRDRGQEMPRDNELCSQSVLKCSQSDSLAALQILGDRSRREILQTASLTPFPARPWRCSRAAVPSAIASVSRTTTEAGGSPTRAAEFSPAATAIAIARKHTSQPQSGGDARSPSQSLSCVRGASATSRTRGSGRDCAANRDAFRAPRSGCNPSAHAGCRSLAHWRQSTAVAHSRRRSLTPCLRNGESTNAPSTPI